MRALHCSSIHLTVRAQPEIQVATAATLVTKMTMMRIRSILRGIAQRIQSAVGMMAEMTYQAADALLSKKGARFLIHFQTLFRSQNFLLTNF